jgi:hypothetical protein
MGEFDPGPPQPFHDLFDSMPDYGPPTVLLDEWRAAVLFLCGILTRDPGGQALGPSYGRTFGPADYAPIPRRDLPFGVPDWLGDDAWGRTGNPRHRNSVSRPKPDDHHTLTWIAPGTT